MSDEHHQIGLSRREMERELNWMLRHMPSDPVQMVKLACQAMITLMDKNNAALAKRVDPHDDGKPGAP
jgi:hypothetical protein